MMLNSLQQYLNSIFNSLKVMKLEETTESDFSQMRYGLSKIKLNYFLLTPNQQQHLKLVEKLINSVNWRTITPQQIDALEALFGWIDTDANYNNESHVFDDLF